jgi:hypothetical protein
VRQGHVPNAENLYLEDHEDDIKKRLRITVSEGAFYLCGRGTSVNKAENRKKLLTFLRTSPLFTSDVDVRRLCERNCTTHYVFCGGRRLSVSAAVADSKKGAASIFSTIKVTFATNKMDTRQIKSFFVAIMRFATYKY